MNIQVRVLIPYCMIIAFINENTESERYCKAVTRCLQCK